jgi:hypothetical protein
MLRGRRIQLTRTASRPAQDSHVVFAWNQAVSTRVESFRPNGIDGVPRTFELCAQQMSALQVCSSEVRVPEVGVLKSDPLRSALRRCAPSSNVSLRLMPSSFASLRTGRWRQTSRRLARCSFASRSVARRRSTRWRLKGGSLGSSSRRPKSVIAAWTSGAHSRSSGRASWGMSFLGCSPCRSFSSDCSKKSGGQRACTWTNTVNTSMMALRSRGQVFAICSSA